MDITSMTAVEIGKKIKAKEITVADAVEAAIAQIERVEENVHSFVRIDKEGARKRAEEVQKMINDGTLTGPLAGVPVAIKDNLCTKGVETTCSSKILEGFKPTFTADAVVNLEKAGAVILVRLLRQENVHMLLDLIQEGPSVSQVLSVELLESSQPTERYPVMD